MNNKLLVSIIIAIVMGAAGFLTGMQYQKQQQPTFAGFNQNGRNQGLRQGGQAGNRFQGGRPVIGEIISSDDKSITVKMQDGSTKIVIVSDGTSINKAAEGSKADLKKGETVAAFGTQNSDGSITAQNIQLNPQMRMFQGGRRQSDEAISPGG